MSAEAGGPAAKAAEKKELDGRRAGSTFAGKVAGWASLGLGIATTAYAIAILVTAGAKPGQLMALGLDAVSCVLFGVVLLWWAASPQVKGGGYKLFASHGEPTKGIGNDTVTMVITVITAIIAIFTLTHELFEKGAC